jgi:hypothetical protein
MSVDAQIADLIERREILKCAPDWDDSTLEEKLEGFLYFCSKYAHIKHPSQGKIPFELREAQIETVRHWLADRYSIVLKARQIGFSTLVSVFCFWLTYFYGDRHIIMLSRTEREAAKLLSHAKYAWSFLPKWMTHRLPDCAWTQKGCVMSNNSALESMPSANDPARGSTAFKVVVDEIAFLPNSDDAWASIEPVADVGGSVIMLSTANGEGNLFHTLWVGSQTKNGTGKQFEGIFFPWWASDRDQDWYDRKAAQTPDWQMAQEYPSNPDEAFLKSGRPVFDLEVLRQIVPEEPRRGRLAPKGSSWEFIEEGGNLAVWEEPQPDGVYAIGADVAFGLEHGDYSVAYVINARNARVVAAWHGHADPDLFGENVLYPLGRWYHDALMGVENNNHGLTVVRTLQRLGYTNQYRQRHLGKRRMKPTDTLGWATTHASKPLAIDELAKALRDRDLDLRDALTVAELRTFVREGDGKMHGSPHDDRVMALAITNQMVKFVWLPEFRPKKKDPPPGTWGYLLKHAYAGESKRQKKKPIGAHSVRKSA